MATTAWQDGQLALPGMEAGKRTEQVQWGLRWVTDTFLNRRGHVEPRPSEENARLCAREPTWAGAEVVRRSVVTYTTAWETP